MSLSSIIDLLKIFLQARFGVNIDITLRNYRLKRYYIKFLLDKYAVPSLFLSVHIIKRFARKTSVLKALHAGYPIFASAHFRI